MNRQTKLAWLAFAVFVAAHKPGPGVDTPEDLARVRRWFDSNGAGVSAKN